MPIADRPVVHGKPVPYITRWTGERPEEKFCRYGILPKGVGYLEEDPWDRDQYGVLWMRELNTPGKGDPEWAQVHSARQRRCMTKRICQVCATKLGDGPYHWLQTNSEIGTERLITETPPLCEQCADVSESHCPALRRGNERYLVASFEQVGWRGELSLPRDGRIERVKVARVAMDDPFRHFLVAKAMTIQMTLV